MDAKSQWLTQTSYGRVHLSADERKLTHYERTRALLLAHIERHPHLFDNGSGNIDTIKVEQRATLDWWKDSELWKQGKSRLASLGSVTLLFGLLRVNGYVVAPNDTEWEAIDNVRQDAKAATGAPASSHAEVLGRIIQTYGLEAFQELWRDARDTEGS